MKDVFQQQHEETREGDVIIGPNGKPTLSPEAQARKTERERRIHDEKEQARRERVEKLTTNLVRKLSIFTEAAKGPDDPQVGPSFKVGNERYRVWLTHQEICRLEAEYVQVERR
jgi:hypothetical protein